MNCLCCHSDEVVPSKTWRGYKLMACKACSFEFVHPLPSQEEIETFYNKSRVVTDLKEIISNNIKDFDNGAQQPKREWFDRVLSEAKKRTQKDKLTIFEIGSGYGYFIHYANKKGHHAIGTEVTADYAAASKGIINGNIAYVPDGNYDSIIDNEWADLIYLEHVFEHVLHPDAITEVIKNKVSPEGILFMSVPNSRSLLAKMMGAKWPWACPPDHLYYYNRKALTAFLENRGFEVVEAFSGDYYFRSIYQMYSLIPYTNILKKALGLKTAWYPYRYPSTLGDYFNLLPYWILWPFLKLAGKDAGNELTVVAKLKK